MSIHYIRRLKGKVMEKGMAPSRESLAELQRMMPGEFFEDDGTTELSPLEPPKLPELVIDPNMVTVEELTDAVIKLADGDKSAISSIALRRKRQINKAEKDGADPGRAAKRSAGRHKAASK